jgi:putative transposase
MYYNKRYNRTGSLFEGKFKSKYAGEDIYLKYLFSYIHLNPLKILDKDWKRKAKSSTRETINFLIKYPYSSFREYYTNQYDVVLKNAFPKYFPSRASFMRDIFSWITLENN